MIAGASLPGKDLSADSAVGWILRIGTVFCFLGHGSLGLMRVATWTTYFGVVGIGREQALTLMPWVGAFDVALALSVLVFPVRSVVLYMAAWSFWTALLRPLAGESIWEFVERAGNFGVPLAFYFYLRLSQATARPPDDDAGANDARSLLKIEWVLRLTTILLLLGHGALGLILKPVLSTHYLTIGLSGSAAEPIIGGLECLLALTILFKPNWRWLLAIVAWKLATEALAPLAGAPFWVFVEHGGSYAAPLALALLQRRVGHPTVFHSAPSAA
jgi:hypothetical protein